MGNDKESGKQSNNTIYHLENNDGTKIRERVDITNRLAQEISKNATINYRTMFKKYQETHLYLTPPGSLVAYCVLCFSSICSVFIIAHKSGFVIRENGLARKRTIFPFT